MTGPIAPVDDFEREHRRWRAAVGVLLGRTRRDVRQVHQLQIRTVAGLLRWMRARGVPVSTRAAEPGARATVRAPLLDLPFPGIAGITAVGGALADMAPEDPDALQRLFHAAIPRALRRELGAFHTPAWLTDLVLAQIDPGVLRRGRVLDPGCGSGAFLRAVRRARLDGLGRAAARPVVAGLLRDVHGIDLDPLAVALARLDLLLDLHRHGLLPEDDAPSPVEWGDSILGRSYGPAVATVAHDALVGNPPWIPWSALAESYRTAIRDDLADRLQFFDRRGFEARLGHANDDVSAVFLRVTGERYLAQGGTLAMVIKRGQLGNVAGSGFRRLTLVRPGPGAEPLGVVRVVDLSALGTIFEDAREPAAVIVARAGRSTEFPVGWERWTPAPGVGSAGGWRSLAEVRDACHREALTASPRSDDLGAPWDVITPELLGSAWLEEGESPPLDIRHGLKHDAEGVFALEVLGAGDGLLRVRNLAGSGIRRGLPVVEAEMEAERVFPYVKCRHLRRWETLGSRAVLVPQRVAGEDDQAWLRETLPRTWSYLERFRHALAQRRSSVFDGDPFYRQFALGPYTWRRHRVAWCSMAREPAFAVVSPLAGGPLAGKPVVLDGACYGIATDDEDEAHYLCALLGSAMVRGFLEARRGHGKRWLSKTALAGLTFPPFDRRNPGAMSLAERSRRAHRAASAGDAEALARAVAELDAAADWHLRRHRT